MAKTHRTAADTARINGNATLVALYRCPAADPLPCSVTRNPSAPGRNTSPRTLDRAGLNAALAAACNAADVLAAVQAADPNLGFEAPTFGGDAADALAIKAVAKGHNLASWDATAAVTMDDTDPSRVVYALRTWAQLGAC